MNTASVLSGMTQVCSGDELSAVNLTCLTTGPLLRWSVTVMPQNETITQFYSAGSLSPLLLKIDLINVTATLSRVSHQPLVSRFVISPVSNRLNGTVVTCTESGFAISNPLSTTIEIIDQENVRIIVQGKY